MELSRALSVARREQDAFEPFLFMGAHLHHEVITVNEQANISFHVHQQREGLLRPWTNSCFFQDLRVMSLPSSTGAHCATHALSQQANVFGPLSHHVGDPQALFALVLN